MKYEEHGWIDINKLQEIENQKKLYGKDQE